MKRIFILIFVSLLVVSCLKEELHTSSVHDSFRFSTRVSEFEESPMKSSGIRVLPLEGESSLALVSVETPAGDFNPETKSVPVTSLEDDFFASGFWYEGSWDGTQTPNLFHRKEISRLEPDVWVTTSVVAPQWPGTGKVRFYAVSPASRQGLTYKSLSTDQGAPVIAFQVEQDVTSQVDVLESVSTDYAGDFNAVVPLTFSHALTAVRVSCEDLGKEAYVRNVTLSGVYSYGKHVIGSSVWTDQKNVASYSLYPDVNLTGSGEEQIVAGKNTMLLMPQTLPAGAKLSVVLRMNGRDFTLNADLSGTEWLPGYLVDYRVQFVGSGVVMGRMEVRDVNPVGGTVQPGVSQQVAEVVSSGLTFSGDWVDVPWEVKGFSEDGDSWSDSAPSWLSTYTGDGDGNGNAFMVSTGDVDEEKRIFVKLGQVSGSAEKVFEVVKESNNLTFTIVTGGDIVWKSRNASYPATIKYKKNEGEWVEVVSSVEGAVIPVVAGDVLEFKGVSWVRQPQLLNETSFFGVQNGCTFEASNSVMSLLPSGFDMIFYGLFMDCSGLLLAPELPETILTPRCYQCMFYGCTGLTRVPELPATSLASSCYQQMFQGCTSLTEAPDLPATSLASSCYLNMFRGCTELIEAPELPATTLEAQCYNSMFEGCTGLTSAPELPATTLARQCYTSMFEGCTSLISAPELLPANTLAPHCYSSMFQGCTFLTSAPELPATVLDSYCYSAMFRGCTSLTSAPELPAFNLASNCYSYMFWGCTNLTSAPELPATSLAERCYDSMFSGCQNLIDVPDILPATTLAIFCYQEMFRSCMGLTAAPELPATTLASNCYYSMFYGCTGLTNAPELPATTLAMNCYYSMFYGCTGLTNAPELPATSLEELCYNSMFSGCTSLTSAPELPATTLAKSCYSQMFSGCTSLVDGPSILRATTLKVRCYQGMFYGCTNLTEAPELPATVLVDYCYLNMFNNCLNLSSVKCLAIDISALDCLSGWLSYAGRSVSSTKTFYKNPAMSDWPVGDSGIPDGWTIQNI